MSLCGFWYCLSLLGHEHPHALFEVLAKLLTKLKLDIFAARVLAGYLGDKGGDEVDLSSLEGWLLDVVDFEIAGRTSRGRGSSGCHLIYISNQVNYY